MVILQFTLPQHPSSGGIYSTQEAFREILGSKIVELVPEELQQHTEGDYQIHISGDLPLVNKPLFPTNLFNVISDLHQISESIQLISIHSIFQIHSIIGYLFARLHKIPYVFIPHGTLDPYVFSYRKLRKYAWMRLIGQQIIDNASAVIVSSEGEAQKAEEFLKRANVEICPWGVKTPDFSQTPIWRSEIRQKLGIKPNQKLLIFLGRLNKMKRPLETVNAFLELKPENWILLMVGIPEDEDINDMLLKLLGNRQIILHSPVYGLEKWKFLAAADAFVNLSYRENFGRSIIEAIAMGLPTLISDGVDIYKKLKSAKVSNVIEICSYQDIVKGLELFLNEPNLISESNKKNAQDFFLENYTHNLFGQKLTDIVSRYVRR